MQIVIAYSASSRCDMMMMMLRAHCKIDRSIDRLAGQYNFVDVKGRTVTCFGQSLAPFAVCAVLSWQCAESIVLPSKRSSPGAPCVFGRSISSSMSSVPIQRKKAKGAAKQQQQQQQQQSQAAAKADEAMTAKAEGPYTDRMLQGAIFVAVAVPWLILVALEKQSPQELAQNLVKDLHIKQAMNEHGFLDDPRFWYIVAALSTPHVFYFIVWTNASIFYRLVKPIGEPFQVFAMMAHGIKGFQACALAVWYFGLDYWLSTNNLVKLPHEALTFLGSRSTAQLILAGELFMLGQLFNGGVYHSIGEAGVYYGCRLGQTVPWVFGFPFSVVPHPQYLGATVSIWGGVLLCATSASVSAGIYTIGVIMTVFYFISSMVEQHL